MSTSPNTAAFHRTPKRAAASGWIGGALEYYDFFIYAQAAALVFPSLFFPTGNPTVGIISSFATFGVGYVARPIGAAVLGHIGDKHGRRNVLVACMVVIGLSTTLIAFLPTYHQIGWLAPAALVVLRLLQGIAVGGEIAGASAMIVEHAPAGRRGMFGSFATQGVQAGQLIAAAVFLPLSAIMPHDAFQSWGWRIPFLCSVVVLLAGYLIRRGVEETPVFRTEEALGTIAKAPLIQALRENGSDMLRVFLMASGNVVPVTMTVFGATYATSRAYGIGFSTTTFLWITVIANAASILIIPFFGALSDRIGRRPNVIAGLVGSGACSFAFLYFISVDQELAATVAAVLMGGVLYSIHNATYPAFYHELFPARIRVTAFALPFNLGSALGAFMPTIFAIAAPPGANVPLIVGSMIFGITLLGGIAAFTARETARLGVDDLGHETAEAATPVASAVLATRTMPARRPTTTSKG